MRVLAVVTTMFLSLGLCLPVAEAQPLEVGAAARMPADASACVVGTRGTKGHAVADVVDDVMAQGQTRAAIVRVTRAGRNVATVVRGTSMTGVPARLRMQFRSGAVAISHLAVALLRLVEDGRAHLGDPVRRWVKDKRIDKRITLRMLIDSTSGIADYVPLESFAKIQTAHPFKAWTENELLDYAFSAGPRFTPGTNWGYSHANFILLGRALKAIAGKPLRKVLRQQVLRPAGLTSTGIRTTADFSGTPLHAYNTDRGVYEDSTYFDPSWTLAHGAIETTDICDLSTSATAIGTGSLLTRRSYRTMVGGHLVGIGGPTPECPDCRAQTERAHYGLGTVVLGGWILQNPFFNGYYAVQAYLPAKKLSIAVVATGTPEAGGGHLAMDLFQRIATRLAPHHPPTP